MRMSNSWILAAVLAVLASRAGAQTQQPQAPSTTPEQQAAAPAEAQPGAQPATGVQPEAAQPAAGLRTTRASWLSDRIPLRVGDVLTVVVDEQTSARERVARIGVGDRSQRARLEATADGDVAVGKTVISSGMDSDSRDVGEAGREGDLVATISVLVTEVLPNGSARIAGAKQVVVDGREQEISLSGLVRSEDVSAKNVVLSSRVAEAKIGYKGKKIGPRMGIVGKILSMLWP